MDVQNPVLEQAALAEFLQKRKMDKHVQHMRRVYSQKRSILLNALELFFRNKVKPWGDASGLHIALQFPGMVFDNQFILNCRNAGIRLQTISQYCSIQDLHNDKLLLGYGHLSDKQIQEGVKALSELIDDNNRDSLN
jgi:GntR family transcriptional regulator/MocR family aminotransferase